MRSHSRFRLNPWTWIQNPFLWAGSGGGAVLCRLLRDRSIARWLGELKTEDCSSSTAAGPLTLYAVYHELYYLGALCHQPIVFRWPNLKLLRRLLSTSRCCGAADLAALSIAWSRSGAHPPAHLSLRPSAVINPAALNSARIGLPATRPPVQRTWLSVGERC
ncbi:MAG: hypothetical protein CM15mP77_0070 [Synechococcus sp.]|nr:MAG: hypothetical protein CM15mP77_0070 [Synechococcus sp.]